MKNQYAYIVWDKIMVIQEHIDIFSPVLKTILEAEIHAGNEVVETSAGWPKPESVMIFLKQPFAEYYVIENIAFRSVDDIHYWKAEYFDRATQHVLACKFG